MGASWKMGGFMMMPGLVKKIASEFTGSKKIAKLTGKLLACALASQYIFKNQTVSFMGFSLGC